MTLIFEMVIIVVQIIEYMMLVYVSKPEKKVKKLLPIVLVTVNFFDFFCLI